jgi:small subunit ribosomal protein S16
VAVRIRLTRVGTTKRPAYRVVATDSRTARDGRSLEILGFYDPLTDPATVQLDAERIQRWIANGATPSETVTKLMRQAGVGQPQPAAAEPARRPRRGTGGAGAGKSGAGAATARAAGATATAAPRRAARKQATT